MKLPVIETLLTPAMFPLYSENIENKNVVVIDILRATTTICVAFENGVEEMIPVGSPDLAKVYQQKGYLAAAERNGSTVDGFELGNSPQEFTPENISGRKIAFTTTNGTRALELSKHAANVIIGSFRNLDAVVAFLLNEKKDTILFCAGWKDKVNLEDTLFAGAVADRVKHAFEAEGDAVMLSRDLYEFASSDLYSYLQKASHVQRFKALHVESDLDVCLRMNTSQSLPVYKENSITLKQNESVYR